MFFILFMRAETERRSAGAATAMEMHILPLVVSLVPHAAFFRLVSVCLAMSKKIKQYYSLHSQNSIKQCIVGCLLQNRSNFCE